MLPVLGPCWAPRLDHLVERTRSRRLSPEDPRILALESESIPELPELAEGTEGSLTELTEGVTADEARTR